MHRFAGCWRLAAGLLLSACLPANAAAQDGDPYHVVAELDARAQTVGWRLASANASFCSNVVPAVGLLVQDLQSWEDPEEARAAFGASATTQVVVGAVADGSPAAEAGLHTGQPLRSITDTVLEIDLPPAEPGTYQRQTALLDLMDEGLQRNGWIAIGIDTDAGRELLRIHGQPVCASRFELVTQGSRAKADGTRVLVSADMALELGDEDAFAFVVAHELAHNVLGHIPMLAEKGRGWGRVRHTEREADRLAVWLMANAGYDTQGAVRFMRGWARERDVGFLDPTHDAWDERLGGVETEIALVAASPAHSGGYDWSRRFPLSRRDAKSGR
ncbi:hypothetical protein [Croceicoccus bisphenolivorans]|uniref:hypothetical protein n=1 Tax=Croceicoccus bisphenolivorans TaxID=1783232 RepID=UPI000836C9FE|nr:hypothetical protein [Croceicoccus bisphenolivorans]